MKIAFVILHYMTSEDTIDCVESIMKMDGEFDVVIVDNHSNNGSIELIEKQYGNDVNIHIIKNKDNLGFSAGNNVGYDYAKNQLGADFILVSNNDIVIEDKNFLKKLVVFYEAHPFHVCGPDIKSLTDGGHQNPKIDAIPNVKVAKSERRRYLLLLLASKLHVYDLLKKKKHSQNQNVIRKALKESYIDNVMLHGAFVIFSSQYVQKEQYAFQPGSFLYCEEAILYRYCKKKGYLMTYYGDIQVNHKEDSSTNSLCENNSKKKREFVFWNLFKSLGVLISVMESEN